MTEGESWKIPVVLRGHGTTGNPHRPRACALGTLSLARERDKRSLRGDSSLRGLRSEFVNFSTLHKLSERRVGRAFIKLFAGRHTSGTRGDGDFQPLGRPNTRSPMMLCWISLVPPAMV